MSKKVREDDEMPTLIKNDLKNRISKNKAIYNRSIERVKSNIRNKNLKQGRVRPRDPDEEEILSRFERKQSK